MKTPESITALLQKPMDRRDFIQHIGVALLLATGGGMIIRSLGGLRGQSESKPSAGGYGSSAYGGSPRA